MARHARTMRSGDACGPRVVALAGLGCVGGELVGARIIGNQAGEWLHQLLLVMRARLPARLAVWPVPIYPTLSLRVQQALGQLFKYPAPPTAVRVPESAGQTLSERPVAGVVKV